MSELTQNLLICAFYNLFILSLAVYLIVFHDWSLWWILGAVACFTSPGTERRKNSGH